MNKQIYEEASEWLVELRVGDIDGASRGRLDAWFRASPEHIQAFLELSNVWESASGPDLDRAHSAEELIERAKAVSKIAMLEHTASTKLSGVALNLGVERNAGTECLADQGVRAVSGRLKASSKTRTMSLLLRLRFAASIVIVFLTLGALAVYRFGSQTYTTGVGEQRTLNLPDGSQVELNTSSSLRVRFSKAERGVELLAGQALFTVAKDGSRPFVVTSDSARVRAVGTQFDVYRKKTETTVTVLEGRVAVIPVSSGPSGFAWPRDPGNPADAAAEEGGLPGTVRGAVLTAGEAVIVTAQQVSKPKKTDMAVAIAWTQKELVFDGASLSEVTSEFNRYNSKRFIVSDRQLGKDFRVTGVFSSTNPTSFLKFLRFQKGFRVDETDQSISISKE